MNSVIEWSNGERATCPLTGMWCKPSCMWLRFNDDGFCVCSIALIADASDMFIAKDAHERILRGDE